MVKACRALRLSLFLIVSSPAFLQAGGAVKTIGRIAPIVSGGLPVLQATNSGFKTSDERRDIPQLGQTVTDVSPLKIDGYQSGVIAGSAEYYHEVVDPEKTKSLNALVDEGISERRVQEAGDQTVVSRTHGKKLLKKAQKTAEVLAPRPADDENFPEEKKVILQVVLGKKYDPAFAPLYSAKVSRMHKTAYPRRQVRIVRGENREEVYDLLQKVLGPDEMISHLFIDTHGNSLSSEDGAWVTALQGIGRIISFGLDRNFGTFFLPIQTRLLEGAAIVVDACRVFAGPREQAVSRARILLDYFGLKNGQVFGPDAAQAGYVWLGWEMFSRPFVLFLPKDFSNKAVVSFWLAVSMVTFGSFLASPAAYHVFWGMLYVLAMHFIMVGVALVSANLTTGIVVRRSPEGVDLATRLRTLWCRKEALGIKPVVQPKT